MTKLANQIGRSLNSNNLRQEEVVVILKFTAFVNFDVFKFSQFFPLLCSVSLLFLLLFLLLSLRHTCMFRRSFCQKFIIVK